ncbi:MAG: hypothetical protein ABEK59_11115 [Halobacteria archaeon]
MSSEEVELEEPQPDKLKSSYYPFFIALGLALTDVGIFSRIGIFSPVSLVVGVIIFVWSVRGILIETGYIGG